MQSSNSANDSKDRLSPSTSEGGLDINQAPTAASTVTAEGGDIVKSALYGFPDFLASVMSSVSASSVPEAKQLEANSVEPAIDARGDAGAPNNLQSDDHTTEEDWYADDSEDCDESTERVPITKEQLMGAPSGRVLEGSNYNQIYSLIAEIFSSSRNGVVEGFSEALTKGIDTHYAGWTLLHLCVYQFAYHVRPSPLGEGFFARFGLRPPKSPEEKRTELIALIELLIINGAAVNAEDAYGRTPICFATDQALLQLLLKKGADINHHKQTSPLHIAAYNGMCEISMFLEQGADPERLDCFDRLSLHYAAVSNFDTAENVEALLQYFPQGTEQADCFGLYPLSYAVLFESQMTMARLLEASSLGVVETAYKQLLFQKAKNAFYTSEYNAPLLFKMQIGGGRDRKEKTNITSSFEKAIKQKSEELTFVYGGEVFSLGEDKHSKHIARSKTLQNDWGNMRERDFEKTYKKAVATFNLDFSQNYRDTLKKVIATVVDARSESVETDFVDMGIPVGWDRGKETKIIELYYGSAIGSHMRPKDGSDLRKEVLVLPVTTKDITSGSGAAGSASPLTVYSTDQRMKGKPYTPAVNFSVEDDNVGSDSEPGS